MLRQYIASCVFHFLRKKAEKRLKKVSGGSLYDAILAYGKASDSTGCGWEDYWLLYKSIRKYRPQEVLECGTGISTLVIAHALQENGSGRVTSMEENVGWFTKAQKLLPERYANIIDLRLSTTCVDTHAMFRGVRYKEVPERRYDFVFIDGPNEAEGVRASDTFDLDFINILRTTTVPVRGIIDTRTGTFWALAHILGHHRVRYNYLLRQGIILPCTKNDLRNTRNIVHDAFFKHSFRRPGWDE